MLLNNTIIVSFIKVMWAYNSIFVNKALKVEPALLRNVGMFFIVSKLSKVVNSVPIVPFAVFR
jgi:hypothetical protein